MKIIISPAKKMNIDRDAFSIKGMPVFIDQTTEIMKWIQSLTWEEAKSLWKCSDRLVALNFERFKDIKLDRCLTPAIFSYEGIQYQYMGPSVMEYSQLDYIQEHLRIVSGFYGLLKPFDGVVPYRLEMQAKASIGEAKDLYDYWGDSIYKELLGDNCLILNLASKEYSKIVEQYLTEEDIFVTCVFGEFKGAKVIQKGTMAKMARGEMVHYLASVKAQSPKDALGFDRLGYKYRADLSSETEYVFIKE